MKFLCVIALFALVANIAITQQPQQNVPSTVILDRILGQGYDWRLHPGEATSPPHPTQIQTNIYIRRIAAIKDGFEVEITFRQNWHDPRLIFVRERARAQFINIHPQDASHKVWIPDTFLQNGADVKIDSSPAPNVLTRVYANGDVLNSQKLSFKLPCPMAFEHYPSDTQVCNLDFASYAYTTNDISYTWKADSPIQVKGGLNSSLAQFVVTNVTTGFCTSTTASGTYSCLRLSLHIKRTPSADLKSKLYLIPVLLVILSWLPFIINAQSIAVRVFVGFACLITLILHWSIIGDDLPKVQYGTGADVWMARCLGFIVATLVQLIFYVWIVRITTTYKERKLARQHAEKEKTKTENDGTVKKDRTMGISLLIDLVSLGIFILAFFIFLLHYFTTY